MNGALEQSDELGLFSNTALANPGEILCGLFGGYPEGVQQLRRFAG
jgi:hypothetical protein